jgi:hypothetical protein
MRKHLWLAIAAFAAAPAFGQMQGGAQSMSAIPDTALPDPSGADIDRAVRNIDSPTAGAAAPTAEQRAQLLAYQENLRIRRQQAEQYAAAAKNGVPLPADAAETLRHELDADIEQWRAEYRVGRKEGQAMRDRWLVDRDSLTAVQWAQQRVDWWAAREAWVAAHHR